MRPGLVVIIRNGLVNSCELYMDSDEAEERYIELYKECVDAELAKDDEQAILEDGFYHITSGRVCLCYPSNY